MKRSWNRFWPHILITGLYLILFAQFPLSGELPGNSDTLLSIALTNVFNETVGLFVRGLPIDTIMYPARNFLAYGENCFGLGLIFTAFKLPTQNDHLAYYFFLVTLYALNSYALFRLAMTYVKSRGVAVAAGLTLPLSNFCLANIDDANVVFIFFPVMAFLFLREGLIAKDVKALKKAILFSSLQIWFGMYIFVFQFLALGLFALFSAKKLKSLLEWKDLRTMLLLYVIPAAPLIGLYVWNHFESNLVSPYDNGLSRTLSSLHLYDFRNVLPGNLLYSSATNVARPDVDISLWYSVRRYCFPGFLMPALALLGFARSFREKVPLWGSLLAVYLVFLGLAFGKNLFAYDDIELMPFGTYFRVASRAYLFALIPVTVYFALGLETLKERALRISKWAAIVVPIVAAGVFILENVPFPMPSYHYGDTLEPAPSYRAFFEKFAERQVVADLPSTYKAKLPQDGPLWTYSRDGLYMNWQTYHRQIIVGGINSYLPKSRTEVEEMLDRLPEARAVADLVKFGVQYVVFHKRFVLFPQEYVLDKLKAGATLDLEFEDEDLAIFRLDET